MDNGKGLVRTDVHGCFSVVDPATLVAAVDFFAIAIAIAVRSSAVQQQYLVTGIPAVGGQDKFPGKADGDRQASPEANVDVGLQNGIFRSCHARIAILGYIDPDAHADAVAGIGMAIAAAAAAATRCC